MMQQWPSWFQIERYQEAVAMEDNVINVYDTDTNTWTLTCKTCGCEAGDCSHTLPGEDDLEDRMANYEVEADIDEMEENDAE